MIDLQQGWLRVRDLPADVLDDMPEYLRSAFAGARRFDFEVEMICAGVRVPPERRAKRRLVLVADDSEDSADRGPLAFDLNAIAADVRASRRVYVITRSSPTPTRPRLPISAAAGRVPSSSKPTAGSSGPGFVP
jgi:hypothetical protein